MLVKMRALISGPRNGQPWPAVGEVIDLSDEEAAALIRHRLADEVEQRPAPVIEEAAVVEGQVETATSPKPRGRPRKNV